MDGQGKSMKAQLKYANKIHAKYVIIVGDDERGKRKRPSFVLWKLVNKN